MLPVDSVFHLRKPFRVELNVFELASRVTARWWSHAHAVVVKVKYELSYICALSDRFIGAVWIRL